MPKHAELEKLTGIAARFGAFVAERHPFALADALAAFEAVAPAREPRDAAGLDALRPALKRELARRLNAHQAPQGLPDATPRVTAAKRIEQAHAELIESCDGFLRRAAISASLTREERLEILRGMILTRATDLRLKAFFLGGEVRYGAAAFQGKGFRSLGQEAIYGACMRLRRGEAFRGATLSAERDGAMASWQGDVIGPMIRDLGATYAMRSDSTMVRSILNSQMAKAGPPTDGKDFGYGDLDRGILLPASPLTIATLTLAGMAMAFKRDGSGRVAVSFIGEGGSSLGEWHEAINLCAARKLPMIFCVQNNQTALSTPVVDQSATRVFAEKAAGYGVPGITLDGTDADAIVGAFGWAAERARAGLGPTLIELVAMRLCGHAHHDDMLYLGRDPHTTWDVPPLPQDAGYANRELYEYWAAKDPIALYAATLTADGLLKPGDLDRMKKDAEAIVEKEARAIIDAPWSPSSDAGANVFANEPTRVHVEVLDPDVRLTAESAENAEENKGTHSVFSAVSAASAVRRGEIEAAPPFDPKGRTFLEAVMLGVGDALRADPRVFVYGEDVGGMYGNAFLLLRPLLDEFGDRLINSPIGESGILGVCVGAAIAGQRPIGEMQFNDFVATGFNQLVNNAAKNRYRWGGGTPMVVRMPWGGLRHAGPYHSQNTEGWFYHTPGLKIVTPSTPHDARALMASAVADPDPVLYYEHIALYRDPRVKQAIGDAPPAPIPLGKAALRRAGGDLAIISYGAFVHVGMRVAEKLAADGIEASVLDLRSLAPLDRPAVLAIARHCHRVLIIHEDARTGGVGESLAAIIQEEAFESLDAPIRIVGALDTPVPYSPALEDGYLPSEAMIERAARLLIAY
jgi:2-oxoisovalerate dehydrogenase E1 component